MRIIIFYFIFTQTFLASSHFIELLERTKDGEKGSAI